MGLCWRSVFLMIFVTAPLAVLCLASALDVVVVSGATGRTGSLIFKALKEQNVNVRSFIRNVTKARERLGCVACDASEGIFVGDVTDPSTLIAPTVGAHSPTIATGAPLVCPNVTDFSKCYNPSGDLPIDMVFNGGKNQLDALAEAMHGSGHVGLISSMGTTVPDSPLNKFGTGQILFYKLNLEADIMSSGLTYVIVKPCGMTMAEGCQKELVVGHDDKMTVMPNSIARADVASLCGGSFAHRLVFGVCSEVGTPTSDYSKVLDEARSDGDSSSSA